MSAFPIGALIQAGGTILGGLLQKKPKVYTPAQNIASTVKGARAAGIHPLAALGASPGYTAVGGGPSVGSAIGDGLDTLGRSLASQKSDAEIAALNSNTEVNKAQAELYRAQSRTLVARATNAVRGGPRINDQPPTAPLSFMGTKLNPVSGTSPAQSWQDRYGDVIENAVGIPSFFYDSASHINKALPTDREIWEGMKRWFQSRNYNPRAGQYGK